jgi:hypothetical protein
MGMVRFPLGDWWNGEGWTEEDWEQWRRLMEECEERAKLCPPPSEDFLAFCASIPPWTRRWPHGRVKIGKRT